MKKMLWLLAGLLALDGAGLVACGDSSSEASATGPNGTASQKSDSGIAWNSNVAYGTLTDVRDGQSYRTVKIGPQTWMAENLNYSGGNIGTCYLASTDSCVKYGRLYTWAQVMAGAASSTGSPSGVQGICPSGWHVPSESEWSALQTVVDASNATDAVKLKAKAGWSGIGSGDDAYGFRALPGGELVSGYQNALDYGNWWTATEAGTAYARYRKMFSGDKYVDGGGQAKTRGFSLRCVQN